MDNQRASELRTRRLRLRRAHADDLQAIHQIMSDEEVMRYWSTPPHSSLEQTRQWLEAMIAADPNGSDEFILEHDGCVAGKLGAWRLPEIGFFLRRDCWGRGLGSEALECFIGYIASTGALYLTADVDPLNEGCLKMLERAGFRETGRASATFKVGERTCDSVYLRLDLQGEDERIRP